jgi:hypothetical protein
MAAFGVRRSAANVKRSKLVMLCVGVVRNTNKRIF